MFSGSGWKIGYTEPIYQIKINQKKKKKKKFCNPVQSGNISLEWLRFSADKYLHGGHCAVIIMSIKQLFWRIETNANYLSLTKKGLIVILNNVHVA